MAFQSDNAASTNTIYYETHHLKNIQIVLSSVDRLFLF